MAKKFFATAALAFGLSLGLATPGKAVVVWFSGAEVAIPTTFGGVFVDFETGATGLAEFPDADANFAFGGFLIGNDAAAPPATTATWQPIRIAADNAATVDNLPLGTVIGPGGPFGGAFGGSFSHIPDTFADGETGYIGFSLEHSTLGTVYGWALVTLNANTAEGTIHKWVYQDNGTPIAAGVPEPTTSLLALLGLAGFVFRRKR